MPFFAWSPDIPHHPRRKYQPRARLPEEHGDRPGGTSGGRALSEAGSARSEGSRRSGRSAGVGREASTGAGHVAREVVVPMAFPDDLGEAHTEPPLDRVTLAPRQPDPACTKKVPPGPDGRQRHLSAVWDMVLESRGVQGPLRISFPCPIVVTGGSNVPKGQELVGLFAYRLVSGHWRVQTGVSRIEEQGTVTTAGVFGLNVVTGWDKRRPEWVDEPPTFLCIDPVSDSHGHQLLGHLHPCLPSESQRSDSLLRLCLPVCLCVESIVQGLICLLVRSLELVRWRSFGHSCFFERSKPFVLSCSVASSIDPMCLVVFC